MKLYSIEQRLPSHQVCPGAINEPLMVSFVNRCLAMKQFFLGPSIALRIIDRLAHQHPHRHKLVELQQQRFKQISNKQQRRQQNNNNNDNNDDTPTLTVKKKVFDIKVIITPPPAVVAQSSSSSSSAAAVVESDQPADTLKHVKHIHSLFCLELK